MASITEILSEEKLREFGLHIASPRVSRYMRPYVEQVNGANIFPLSFILRRIHLLGKVLNEYNPNEVLVYSSHPNAENALDSFKQLTGVNTVFKRVLPGILSNPQLSSNTGVVLLMDIMRGRPEVFHMANPQRSVSITEEDFKNEARLALEASKQHIPVYSGCNSNAILEHVDYIVPFNTFNTRAIGVFYYLLARAYLLAANKITPSDLLPLPLESFFY